MMGNRSERRFPNLSCRWALEAAEMTKRRRADFHQGPERQMKLPKEPEYMAAIGFTLTHRQIVAGLSVEDSHAVSGLSNIGNQRKLQFTSMNHFHEGGNFAAARRRTGASTRHSRTRRFADWIAIARP